MNPLKKRLQEGRAVLGFMITMPSVHVAQTLARTGADWLMIDLEHGAIDLPAVHAMIAATSGTPCTPVVRVPRPALWMAKPVLDSGAFGVVFPMVCSGEDAETAVQTVRYPPAGERGLGPSYAPARWGISAPDYIKTANDHLLTIVLIEHGEAIERLDEILAVPGIDVAVIAPNDLSGSLGVPGQRDHPDVLAAIAKSEERILPSKVALGGVATSPEDANRKIAQGYRWIVLAPDSGLLQAAAVAALKGIER